MKLYQYQQDFLLGLPKSLIMDADMGVGKSIMSLEHYKRHNWGNPLLILAPASKVRTGDWEREVTAYLGKNVFDQIHIIIVSYDRFARNPMNYTLPEMTIIADECHYIKNSQSKRGKAIRKAITLSTQFIGLSATPLPNGWQDLENYAIIFGLVRNKTEFQRTFVRIDRSRGFPIVLGYNFEKKLKQFWERVAYPLRRDTAMDLPANTFVPVNFTTKPKAYTQAKLTRITEDGDVLDNPSSLLHHLRQTLTTPEKLDYLADIIDSTTDNVVVFYNYNSEREAILEMMDSRLKHKRLFEQNGHMQNLPQKHEWDDISNSVTLAHYKSGSTGVEMTYANVTVYFSPTYSYAEYKQSQGRTDRHGQTKKIVYYCFRVENTVEGDVYTCLKNKQDFKENLWVDGAIKN